MTEPTPQESETEENFFADRLELERYQAAGWKEAAELPIEDGEEAPEAPEKIDPFDAKPKKRQQNWLSHRIEDEPKIADVMKKRKRQN